MSLPSSSDHRCVVIRVACEGQWVGNRGGFGPSTGHRMDNREPQSCFKRLNRVRCCNNNKFTPFHFASSFGPLLEYSIQVSF